MPKNKILVVDDEKSMREFLEIMLRRDGYDVEAAESGAMALEKIEYIAKQRPMAISPAQASHYIHNPLAEAHSRHGDGGGRAPNERPGDPPGGGSRPRHGDETGYPAQSGFLSSCHRRGPS